MKPFKTLEQSDVRASRQVGMPYPLYVNEVRRDSPLILDGITGAEGYMSRMALTLSSGDLVAIPDKLFRIVQENRDYLSQLGITNLREEDLVGIPDSDCMLRAVRDELARSCAAEGRNSGFRGGPVSHVIPFIAAQETDLIAREHGIDTGTHFAASEMLNHKGFVTDGLRERGVRVPNGYTVRSEHEAKQAYLSLKRIGVAMVCVNVPRGASGLGLFPCVDDDAFEKNMAEPIVQASLKRDGLLIQEFVTEPQIGAVCCVLYVGDRPEDDLLIGITDQQFDMVREDDPIPMKHSMNFGPSEFLDHPELMPILRKCMNFARENGQRGYIGIDGFFTGKKMCDSKLYVSEFNARINSSTGLNFLAHDLLGSALKPDQHFALANSVTVPQGTSVNEYAEFLSAAGIEYDPSKKKGVILMNAGTAVFAPKLQVAVVGRSRRELVELLNRAEMVEARSSASATTNHVPSGIGLGSVFGFSPQRN